MIAPCAQFHLQASHLDPADAISVPELMDGSPTAPGSGNETSRGR